MLPRKICGESLAFSVVGEQLPAISKLNAALDEKKRAACGSGNWVVPAATTASLGQMEKVI